jgi:hypothetical protein
MSIFGIGRLKTTVTNNLLLVSADKSIIISIDYYYQLITIINSKCYNKSFFSRAGHIGVSSCGLAGKTGSSRKAGTFSSLR